MSKISKLLPLWVILSSVFAVLMIVVIIGSAVAFYFEPAINTMLGTTNVIVVQKENAETGDTEYFKSGYKYDRQGEEQLIKDGKTLFRNLVEEGAALLKNENDALPFGSYGKNITVFGTGLKNITSLSTVLSDGGYTLNTTVYNHYNSQSVTARRVVGVPDWSVTTAAVGEMSGDIALITISRRAGEGTDCAHPGSGSINTATDPANGDYLDISAGEESMMAGVKALKDAGKFKKIVAVINTSNMVHGDFINDARFGIDACVWMGQADMIEGTQGLLNVLEGKVNPSGRLVDTVYMNNLDNPVMQNFGRFYADLSGLSAGKEAEVDTDIKKYNTNANGGYWKNYVVYQEGIYLGYKYYETRYEDYVLGQGNAGSFSYSDYVAYPFGAGQSYTTWSYSNYNVTEKDKEFEIKVDVKNTGSVEGKHSVLIYLQKPYNGGGVEQASVNLVGFGKTASLKGGASETVTVTVEKEHLRSYDADKDKTYIYDSGDYYLTAAGTSHDAVNNILAKKGKTPSNTAGKMDAAGSSDMVYTWNNGTLDNKKFSKTEATGYEVTNLFDDVDPNKDEYAKKSNTVKWLSRKDWTGTLPTKTFEMKYNNDMAEQGKSIQYVADEQQQKDTKMPNFGVANGLTLAMFMDRSYDDPMWYKLLEQMTYEETAKLVMNCWYGSDGVKSVGKLRQTDQDSSKGRSNPFTANPDLVGVTSTSGDLRAATFNKEIMEKVGIIQGENNLHASTDSVKAIGLYGYSPNIHRSPYSGRNGEYFSEDAFITGIACGLGVKGMTDKGSVCFTKHFFLNDQEDYRHGISTWANEQTLRETYLPAFEYTVTKGGGMGFMNSFNRIGMTWVGQHKGAQLEFLYGECGFEGNIVTDLYEADYQDVIDGLLAHTTMWLGTAGNEYSYGLLTSKEYKNDPVIVNALVEAAHRMLYGSSRSAAMNGLSASSEFKDVIPWWKGALIAGIVVFSVLTVAGAAMIVLSIVERKRNKA